MTSTQIAWIRAGAGFYHAKGAWTIRRTDRPAANKFWTLKRAGKVIATCDTLRDAKARAENFLIESNK